MTVAFFEKLKNDLIIQRISLCKGEYLFQQDTPVVKFFFITTGRIKLTRQTVDGSPIILHVGQSHEFIAEASLFSEHYHCSAISDSHSTVESINKSDLLLFLENNPQEMKHLLSIFANQVRDLRAINEIKNIKSANERILTFLRQCMNTDNNFSIQTSLKDIAYKIGLTHETLYRELKKLERNHKISRFHNSIQIHQK